MRFLMLLLLAMASCSIKPDGMDSKGYYHYQDSCVKSHTAMRTRIMMIGKVASVQPYYTDVCDSSVFVKVYIPLNRVRR